MPGRSSSRVAGGKFPMLDKEDEDPGILPRDHFMLWLL